MIENIMYSEFQKITYDENNNSLLKSLLIFSGCFLFSICFIIPIHEIGHAISLYLLGMQNISIKISPFMGSTTYEGTVNLSDANFVLLGGPLFNLLIATVIASLVWKTNDPNKVILKFASFMAFYIEGIVALTTFLFNSPITDWGMLATFGLPSVLTLVISCLFIIISAVILFNIWNTININSNRSLLSLILVSISYFIYLLFTMFVALYLIPTEMVETKDLIINNFLIQIFVFSGFILIYKYLFFYIKRFYNDKIENIPNSAVYLSLTLGISMVLFSIVFFN